HHRVGADHAPLSDAAAFEDDYPGADPDIVFDHDGLAVAELPVVFRVVVVVVHDDGVLPDGAVVTDGDGARGGNVGPVVDVGVVADGQAGARGGDELEAHRGPVQPHAIGEGHGSMVANEGTAIETDRTCRGCVPELPLGTQDLCRAVYERTEAALAPQAECFAIHPDW